MGIEPILDLHGRNGLPGLVQFPTGNFAGSSCKSKASLNQIVCFKPQLDQETDAVQTASGD